jgi:hypothetical protein
MGHRNLFIITEHRLVLQVYSISLQPLTVRCFLSRAFREAVPEAFSPWLHARAKLDNVDHPG